MAEQHVDRWDIHALCKDKSHQFFDFPENKAEIRISKSVCKVCPVRLECLAYAFCYSTLGLWGGTTETERKRAKAFLLFPTRASEKQILEILIENTDD